METTVINSKKCCSHCSQPIESRDIQFYSELIKALYRVSKWCRENNVYEFEMKEVRDLLGKNEYARFGDLVWFGGIVYKKGKASYGINIERSVAYFKGELKAPLFITLDYLGRKIGGKDGYITDIKKLKDFLSTENRLYMSKINQYKI